MWLEVEPELHTANFLATGITQNGLPGTVDVSAGTSSPYADSHSLSAAGLQVLCIFEHAGDSSGEEYALFAAIHEPSLA